MYLPLLSHTSKLSEAKSSNAKRNMHSTSVPLARIYGGLLTNEKLAHAGKKTEWEPYVCDDMIVYIRRAAAI